MTATGTSGALHAGPAARDVQRVGWVDTGRGIAITLVVLYHSAQWLTIPGFHTATWQSINDVLATLRMPLFFTISGMFAGKWLTSSWPALWEHKLSLYGWVYMLWTLIATGPFILGLAMNGQTENLFGQYRYVLIAPAVPRLELWFIWALSLLFIGARLLRPLPILVQLVATGIVSALAFSVIDLGNVGWNGLLKYAFFFLLGVHHRSDLFRIGSSGRRGRLLAAAALWALMAVLGVVLDVNGFVGYYFVTALLGVVAGISASRLLSRVTVLSYVGTRTLPVYLAHTSIILLMAWPLQFVPDAGKTWESTALVVPLVAAIALLLALSLQRLLNRTPPTRLFYVQPRWLQRPWASTSRLLTRRSTTS